MENEEGKIRWKGDIDICSCQGEAEDPGYLADIVFAAIVHGPGRADVILIGAGGGDVPKVLVELGYGQA